MMQYDDPLQGLGPCRVMHFDYYNFSYPDIAAEIWLCSELADPNATHVSYKSTVGGMTQYSGPHGWFQMCPTPTRTYRIHFDYRGDLQELRKHKKTTTVFSGIPSMPHRQQGWDYYGTDFASRVVWLRFKSEFDTGAAPESVARDIDMAPPPALRARQDAQPAQDADAQIID